MRPLVRILAGAVLGALLASCTSTTQSASPPATPSPTAPTPSVGPSPSPRTSPTAKVETLADGRYFGFITEVRLDTNPPTIVFDLAQFLTGKDAVDAAVEDGVIGPGEALPNDYYVRNQNKRLRTLSVSPSAKVTIVDWANCCDSTSGDLPAFAAAFGPGDSSDPAYRGRQSSYWLTIKDGAIVAIEEQYLP